MPGQNQVKTTHVYVARHIFVVTFDHTVRSVPTSRDLTLIQINFLLGFAQIQTTED